MNSTDSALPVFAPFDRIRIVNLPHRADRRAEMMEQLRRVGLAGDRRVEFFAAVSPPDAGPFSSRGANGCFLSHKAILQDAATAGQSVLILEDDCDFLLPDITQYRFPGRWDVFYGGVGAASDPGNLHDSDIIGSHFMGFSARAASVAADYLGRYTRPDFAADPRAAAHPDYDHNVRPPVDGAFVWLRRAHPELVTEFAQLGVQRPSRTDIGDLSFFDRVPLLRDVVQAARRVRRRLKQAR